MGPRPDLLHSITDSTLASLMRHLWPSVYEARGQGLFRFLMAPLVGMLLPATALLLIFLAVSGWFWLITLVYLVWIEVRP